MELCDISTRKELMNTALSLFEWAVDVTQKGQSIAAYDRQTDHVEIIKMIPLENAVRRTPSHKKVELVRTDSVEGGEDGKSKLKLARPANVLLSTT
jgi:hypothetical protein